MFRFPEKSPRHNSSIRDAAIVVEACRFLNNIKTNPRHARPPPTPPEPPFCVTWLMKYYCIKYIYKILCFSFLFNIVNLFEFTVLFHLLLVLPKGLPLTLDESTA